MSKNKKGFFRFPAIHKDKIIFTAEGNLWYYSLKDKIAQRLTSHIGLQVGAKISPDGKLVAFTGTYEGISEVFVMPIEGGLPKRLSFCLNGAIVTGWTKDNKIIYRSSQRSPIPEDIRLFTIDPKTMEEEEIPLDQASAGVYDDEGKILYFVKLPNQGSHTKGYKGGYIEQIWKFDGKNEALNLTADFEGSSKNPMYYDGRIYFLSDRDEAMNIWSMDEIGKDLKQHTHYQDFEIRTADLHEGKIIYQLAGDLKIYDIKTAKSQKLEISLRSDFEHIRERWVENPLDYLESYNFAPKGDKILMTSRGRVFSIPVKDGRLVKVSGEEYSRYKHAKFLDDGKSVVALADKEAEFEFYQIDSAKKKEERKITNNSKILNLSPYPSPDGKFIIYGDKNNTVFLTEVETGVTKEIISSEYEEIESFSWSPDSKFVAFSAVMQSNFLSQIYIYDLAKGESFSVTTDRYSSYSPAWSKDGKWLYFISDRHFNSLVESPWGERQPEPYFPKTGKIFLLDLIGLQKSPFLKLDELEEQSKEAEKDSKKDEEKKEEKEEIKVVINREGLENRLWEVPIEPEHHLSLTLAKDRLFSLVQSVRGEKKFYDLKMVKITNQEKLKVFDLATDISGYKLATAADKLLIKKKKDFFVFDSTVEKIEKWDDAKVNLSSWKFSLDPVKEWKQMLVDAWRMERDYFYDIDLHGADYQKLLDLHLPLVEKVTDREELNELISMLVGEMRALHTFVRGGDLRRGKENIRIGALGADLRFKDQAWVIHHIYRADPDRLNLRSPLLRPDLDIKEGDLLVAIDGQQLSFEESPNKILRNKINSQIMLRTLRDGKEKEQVVKTISPLADFDLRYGEWEYLNRLKVEQDSNNTIGYLHLRAMGKENYEEWVHNFYPVYDRKGLIIDVRNNHGGNIDSWILEKLLRKVWFYWQSRDSKPFWNMQYAFRGHIVVLCNEKTASDGEAFSEGIRRLGIGEIIGKRTWGGEIWLSMNNLLADKGIASAAQMGVYDEDGNWLIEGRGVEVDYEVDNLPLESYRGVDRQLDFAINHLKKKIEEDPREVPKAPAFPRPKNKMEKL